MRANPCPISSEELQRLYQEEKLTDEALAQRLGQAATAKRVRSWRKRFGIETIQRTSRNEVPTIEGRLRSVLVGSMLGDGRLSRTANSARYHENHCDAQKGYISWKANEWGSWVSDEIKPVIWKKPAGDFPGWRFHTVSHASLLEWHSFFYDATGPKRLDRGIVPLVDELALAVWFMDDGSTGWWPRITFGMDPVSQGIAMAIFLRHGFKPRWEVHKGNTGEFIFEGEDQAHRFIDLVKPHMPECMSAKLVFGFQGPHYHVRRAATEEVLCELAGQGMPLAQMARELGVGHMTVSRYLKKYGIPHPRRIGRPQEDLSMAHRR